MVKLQFCSPHASLGFQFSESEIQQNLQCPGFLARFNLILARFFERLEWLLFYTHWPFTSPRAPHVRGWGMGTRLPWDEATCEPVAT